MLAPARPVVSAPYPTRHMPFVARAGRGTSAAVSTAPRRAVKSRRGTCRFMTYLHGEGGLQQPSFFFFLGAVVAGMDGAFTAGAATVGVAGTGAAVASGAPPIRGVPPKKALTCRSLANAAICSGVALAGSVG